MTVKKIRAFLPKFAIIAPIVSLYMFSRGDMDSPAIIFSLIALVCVSACAVDLTRELARLEKECEKAQRQCDEYKKRCELQEKCCQQGVAGASPTEEAAASAGEPSRTS